MSTSLVSTVLGIENEAEAILKKAGADAEKIAADGKTGREAATKAFQEKIQKEIAQLEVKAAEERALKVQELTATGEAALSAVRNISEAAFTSGVKFVMDALDKK